MSTSSKDQDEPPPIARTWARMYLIVILWLGLLIVAFYWFARRFAP